MVLQALCCLLWFLAHQGLHSGGRQYQGLAESPRGKLTSDSDTVTNGWLLELAKGQGAELLCHGATATQAKVEESRAPSVGEGCSSQDLTGLGPLPPQSHPHQGSVPQS